MDLNMWRINYIVIAIVDRELKKADDIYWYD